MISVVFIPGLGADERLFKFIKLQNCEVQFVKWEKPQKNELWISYLNKIKSRITLAEPILIGVSLGGIVAMELREMMPVQKTILVSSIKNKFERPPYFNFIKKIRLNEKISAQQLKKASGIIKPLISDMSNKKALKLFSEMVKDADDDFISWGISQVLNWQKETYNPEKLIHIHGTRDIVFPLHYIKHCNYKIKGGSHDMIMSKPEEINEILNREIVP